MVKCDRWFFFVAINCLECPAVLWHSSWATANSKGVKAAKMWCSDPQRLCLGNWPSLPGEEGNRNWRYTRKLDVVVLVTLRILDCRSHRACCDVQPSGDATTFQGSIRVLMNLIRPITMCISVEPPLHDVTARQDDARVTSFYLPKDTTKVIHISRSDCCLLLLVYPACGY